MSEFQTAREMRQAEVPDRILLLDTETTGLKGASFDRDPGFRPISDPAESSRLDALDWNAYGDLVLDIGICEVSLEKGTVTDVYSSIVGYDTSVWNESMEHSWIFENSDLKLSDISKGKPLSKVITEVRNILKDRWVTSYNVQYDLDKFLYKFPWCLKGSFREVRDPMFSATEICRLPSPLFEVKSFRYPKLDYAYKTILKGEDPAGIEGVQDHRALSDARMASHVMVRMYREGRYNPLDFSGRHFSPPSDLRRE